jgi:thiosulfate/3-mercaptopyruvate sulfurtransferase
MRTLLIKENAMKHLVWKLGAALTMVLPAFNVMASVLPGPLVSTQWLADNADKVQIVEVRGNTKSFAAEPEISVDAKGKRVIEDVGGHIPGSVLMDAKKMRVDRKIGDITVKYMLPEAVDFEKFVQASGVNATKPLVLVPVGAEVADVNDALRMYWQFKVYGQDEMAVLDGGYLTWLVEGRAHAKDAPTDALGNWAVKSDRSAQYFADSNEVAQAIENHQSTLVDSRDAPFYHGVVKRDYVFGYGHLQGAKLYPTELMFKSVNGALKFMPASTYAGLMQAQGVDPKGAAITYCNSGHLSSGPWFVLSELLGNHATKLYAGSLHEWTLENRPMVGAVPLQ